LIVGVLCVVGLAILGGGSWALFRHLYPPPGAKAEARERTRWPEEELVRRYIVNNAEDPGAVVFTKWGPHMTRQEFTDLLEEAVGKEHITAAMRSETPDMLVRVVYRERRGGQETSRDEVYGVLGKLVTPLGLFNLQNQDGDNWKVEARKRMAKVFPAVEAGDH
jgi:hypothetical protein